MIDSPLDLPKKVRRLVIRKLPLILVLGLLASGCFAERSMTRPPARSPIPSTAPVDTTVHNAAANWLRAEFRVHTNSARRAGSDGP